MTEVCLEGSSHECWSGNVWKSPSQFYPAGFIRINPPGKSQKNPHEGGFFQKTAKNWLKMVTFVQA